MNNKIVVTTTFGNESFDVYAKKMIQSFVANWPQDVSLFISLDDDLLADTVAQMIRAQDCVAIGWTKEHADFVARNKEKDDPQNYRKQAVRFCHKVFAIHATLEALKQLPEMPRYLVWMDADVLTNSPVSIEDLKLCLPKEGRCVSYLGRVDWDHSECGWLAFDLQDGGGEDLIRKFSEQYANDFVMSMSQQHDSWVFDRIRPPSCTNLTPNAKGMDAWSQSPMAKWSTHYKGPEAKAKLVNPERPAAPMKNQTSNIIIQTRNAIPHETIREHITVNQALIKNWVSPCKAIDEEIIVVSAGPMLIAEDIRKESGKKIVAVKHALTPLKKAGIKPWACILLDPRPHVADFVKDADPDVIWFVASQVNPNVTMQLLQRGCTIWGYHAAVGAGEDDLTAKQEYSIISGGSATATRGLFMLNHLGFNNFTLYGYDLCVPDKPDMNAKDEMGQSKYFEMSIGMNDPLYSVKKLFWAEPQLIAQFEEINDLIKSNKFNLTAYGDGIVPFMIKAKMIADLRRRELRDKMVGENPPYYMDLLNGTANRPANGSA